MPLLSNKKLSIKSASLEAEVMLRAAQGDAESWIFIVPNRIAERRLEQEILEASGGRALGRLNILTLADLAGKLASAALPDHRYIGDAESAVLVELSIRELLQERKLSFFDRAVPAPDSAFPVPRGTFELIHNTVRQLKETGIAPIDIEHDLAETTLRSESTHVERATDILRIYERYHSFLDARKLMDTYGQTLLMNERYSHDEWERSIHSDFQRSFPAATDIFLSGFYYLEPPSIALIDRLAHIPNVTVAISFAEHNNNPDLFDGLIKLGSQLKEKGFGSEVRAPAARHPIADHAASRLFRSRNDSIEKRVESSICYLPAYDALSEIEAIARQIVLLSREDPEVQADLSHIVLATPTPETYTPLVREVFREYEIPVHITDRHHLDRSPLVRGILSLVETARSGIRRRELVRMLLSPYFDFPAALGEIDIQNLLDIVARHTQNSTLDSMERALEVERIEAEQQKNDSVDSIEFARHERDLTRIVNAIRDLKHVHKFLRPISEELLTATEFSKQLRAMLSALRFSENIFSSSAILMRLSALEMDTRAYRAFGALLDEMEQLFYSIGEGQKKHPIAFYEQRLKAALSVSRYNTRPKNGAVLVTSLAQSISQPAKYLFLAGLAEGTFPAPYQPQVFLTSSLQKGERKQLLEDRVLFYQAITNYGSKLYLSSPAKSASGAPINRSSMLDAMDEIFEITISKQPEGIFSRNDLYRSLSRFAELPTIDPLNVPEPWRAPLMRQVPNARKATSERLTNEATIYRGDLDLEMLSENERMKLESNKSRVWSITQLERYAKCHFRFFAQDILGLREETRMEDGLDATERGSALHEVLRELLTSRRSQNAAIQDTPEQELPSVFSEARQLAKNYFEKSNADPFWRIDSESLLAEKKDGGPLEKFIQKEHERGEWEVRPRFFEVSFGGSGRAARSPIDSELSQDEAIVLGSSDGFMLRGKIDRIDISKDSEPDDGRPGNFMIVDYKSGRSTPRHSEIERGISLQLPLYLRVAEDLLRKHYPELKGVAALYHKVLSSESERNLGLALSNFVEVAFEKVKGRSGLLENETELKDVIEQTVQKAKEYVEGVARGNFPLIEADLIRFCAYCPYDSVCRVREAEQAGILL